MNLGKIYVRETEDQFEATEYFVEYINVDWDACDKQFIGYRMIDKEDNVHWLQYYPADKKWTTYVDNSCIEKKEIYVTRIDICPLGDSVVSKSINNNVCDDTEEKRNVGMAEVKFDYQERERLRGECAIRDVIIEALARDIINFRNK